MPGSSHCGGYHAAGKAPDLGVGMGQGRTGSIRPPFLQVPKPERVNLSRPHSVHQVALLFCHCLALQPGGRGRGGPAVPGVGEVVSAATGTCFSQGCLSGGSDPHLAASVGTISVPTTDTTFLHFQKFKL